MILMVTKNDFKVKCMNIQIVDVIPPSEAQVKSNILGTVNLMIVGEDNMPIARLNGLTVRRNKQEKRFLAAPSYPVGEGEKKQWYNHYTMFPTKTDDDSFNNKQRATMDTLTEEVLRVLDSGGTRKQKPSGGGGGQAKPQAVAPTSSSAGSKTKDPWN